MGGCLQLAGSVGLRQTPSFTLLVWLFWTDDIIRLNKKEQQQLRRRQAPGSRRPVKKKGRLSQVSPRAAAAVGPAQRGVCLCVSVINSSSNLPCTCVMQLLLSLPGGGAPRGGVPKLRNRRVPPLQGLRRGQGVITGLAARRPTALLKRLGTLNRAAINQVMEDTLEDIGILSVDVRRLYMLRNCRRALSLLGRFWIEITVLLSSAGFSATLIYLFIFVCP